MQLKAITRILNTPKKQIIAAIAAALILLLLWQFAGSIKRAVTGAVSDARDAQSERQIKGSITNANSHEASADKAEAERQKADGAYERSHQEREDARRNSRSTLEPTRQAKNRYEETRNANTSDLPSIPDDRICAELARRSIPCQ